MFHTPHRFEPILVILVLAVGMAACDSGGDGGGTFNIADYTGEPQFSGSASIYTEIPGDPECEDGCTGDADGVFEVAEVEGPAQAVIEVGWVDEEEGVTVRSTNTYQGSWDDNGFTGSTEVGEEMTIDASGRVEGSSTVTVENGTFTTTLSGTITATTAMITEERVGTQGDLEGRLERITIDVSRDLPALRSSLE